ITVAGTAPAAADPATDNTITLSDYDFSPAHPVTAGAHTFRVDNAGPQLHELMILRLLPGKSVADIQAWARNEMKGPPPARQVGRVRRSLAILRSPARTSRASPAASRSTLHRSASDAATSASACHWCVSA